jgi:hypothetical protein
MSPLLQHIIPTQSPATMPASPTITTTLKPTLLALPRELRNEIYTHLFLPSHTYSTSPRPSSYAIKRLTPTQPTYIEDEIFLPTRPPLNLLHTCAQTRHEVLEQTALAFNNPPARRQPSGTATPPPPSSSPNPSAAPATTTSDTSTSTSTNVNDATAPVTLTLKHQIPVRGPFGPYTPARTALSPRFHALLPLLTLPKRLRFTIWAGWTWWDGPPLTRTSPPLSSGARRVARRVSCDETDCVEVTPRTVRERERDTLGVVLGKVLGCLSGVEEVEVEVRILVWDYCNWDLPVRRWERVEGWLGGSVVGEGDGDGGRRRWRRVERRLVAYDTMEEGGKKVVFFRKEEIWGGGGRVGDVTEETAKVS